MNIIGMKQNNQVDKIIRTMGHNSMGVISKELRLGDIKRRGGQVFTDNTGYVIKGLSGLPTVAFVNMLKKENPNVIKVNYKSDLEGNDQISETEEPLWTIDKKDGNFHIKRNF